MGIILRYILLALLIYWLLRRWQQKIKQSFSRQSSKYQRGASSHKASKNPYQVLGVPPSAPPEEIRRAYRTRLAEYHPDKVEHLGEELKKVAKEKSQEILKAYEDLGKP